jgi:hypothetical protein
MSVLATHISVDGARNTTLEVNLSVDHDDGIKPTVILDPRKRFVDPITPTTKYRVDYINYVFHKDLSVDLWWEIDGEEPVLLRHLEGRGMIDAEKTGGLHNNAGENKTGCLMLSAYGWTGGDPLKGSLTIEAVKQ